jgi:hypothetical protein
MRCVRNVLAAVLLASVSVPVPAADHRDGPLATGDPTADLNDVYLFMNPNNANEVVIVTTVVPFATFGSRFSDAVEYRTHVDNGAGTITILCRFANQSTTVSCSGGTLSVAGNVGATLQGNGLRMWTGLRDDPFFFDSPAFNRTRTTLVPSFTNPGVNFFTGNTLAIVMAIDRNRLTNNGANPVLRVYGSTRRSGTSNLSGGISGSWYDAANPGHGIAVEVLGPASAGGRDRLNVAWHVYNNFGAQRWIFGTGEIDGSVSAVPAFTTTGGRFPPQHTFSQVVLQPFGTLTFNFTSCSTATLTVDSNTPEFPDTTVNLTRLTSIRDVPCAVTSTGQIDRNGRPGINTVLIDVLRDTGLKDQYNRADNPTTWAAQFQAEMQSNLAALDTLDGVTGNAVLPPAPLAGVLVDDRLIIDTRIATCDAYLAVELGVAGQCGGRTLRRDVIDDSLGAIVGPGVRDNVAFDSVLLNDFPFLGEPR